MNSKSKSESRKRSSSASVNLVFRLDQRYYDNETNSTLLSFMGLLAQFLAGAR
jgi:hypothetical protein